jgi:maltooligosyltrehalose trehalohydrolase
MPQSSEQFQRRLPVGAETGPNGNTHFRVWAPGKKSIQVVFADGRPPASLEKEAGGYHSGWVASVSAGTEYKYRIDETDDFPDPASRFQPRGPHQFSAVVDPDSFTWSDSGWQGCSLKGQVVYELHLGTFTAEGTWSAALKKLPYLRDTGITAVEIMPVAEFPGRFGWGYDGVLPFAATQLYGTPDDMRRFVDRAHNLGISVILDVVYNHLGPDGNYFSNYSEQYFSRKHTTDWGAAINFDDDGCEAVREFFKSNAAYWIREFHLDGLRLDATQDIHDDTEPHVLAEISQAARNAAPYRSIVLIGENEPQNTALIRPCEHGGCGLDALWNDDLHHSAMVALTGRADAYYTDYRGSAGEFAGAMKYGYLYQGQWYRWQKKRRGTPTFGTPHEAMVTFIQNHDQIANSARGLRAHKLTSPSKLKAITAMILLGPGTPMLFQGQEFAASNPFLFFADHKADLSKLIREGRVQFLQQWRSLRLPEMLNCFADPGSETTFQRSKLDFAQVEQHSEIYRLHRDLLKIRREDPVISKQGAEGLDTAVLSPHCFLLRYFSGRDHQEDRLLIVNLGADLELNPAPEPLLGPPLRREWLKLWSTEDPQYGGCGTPPLDTEQNWSIPGESAVVLYPRDIEPKK